MHWWIISLPSCTIVTLSAYSSGWLIGRQYFRHWMSKKKIHKNGDESSASLYFYWPHYFVSFACRLLSAASKVCLKSKCATAGPSWPITLLVITVRATCRRRKKPFHLESFRIFIITILWVFEAFEIWLYAVVDVRQYAAAAVWYAAARQPACRHDLMPPVNMHWKRRHYSTAPRRKEGLFHGVRYW